MFCLGNTSDENIDISILKNAVLSRIDDYYIETFVSRLILSKSNLFILNINFLDNKDSIQNFFYIKQLNISADHSLVLDGYNYEKESLRWEKIEKGELIDTDEEVSD